MNNNIMQKWLPPQPNCGYKSGYPPPFNSGTKKDTPKLDALSCLLKHVSPVSLVPSVSVPKLRVIAKLSVLDEVDPSISRAPVVH